MKMIARYPAPGSPERQIAATYLLVMFEGHLRQISGLLDWEGKWIPPDGYQRALAILPDNARLRNRPERCSDIAITDELAIRNSKDPRAGRLLDLDRRIADEIGDPTYNIGQRIAFLRHQAAHGNTIAVESDGIFYSLLMIVLIMSDPSWPADSV
jgi:hypothetical protein